MFLVPTIMARFIYIFFFQAEDGIRDLTVTGVQTCALPICVEAVLVRRQRIGSSFRGDLLVIGNRRDRVSAAAVRVGDLGVGLRCRREPEPRSPVRVQVRAMPRMRRRSVRIVEMRSGEGARRVEPIRRGTRVRQSKNDRQRYEGGFEQEVLKLYTRRQASY